MAQLRIPSTCPVCVSGHYMQSVSPCAFGQSIHSPAGMAFVCFVLGCATIVEAVELGYAIDPNICQRCMHGRHRDQGCNYEKPEGGPCGCKQDA